MLDEWLDKLRIALGERRYAYRKTFDGPLAEVVLKDLARFCRAHESTFHADPRAHAVAEGRREVWLRIADRKSTRLNSSHVSESRMPSSA